MDQQRLEEAKQQLDLEYARKADLEIQRKKQSKAQRQKMVHHCNNCHRLQKTCNKDKRGCSTCTESKTCPGGAVYLYKNHAKESAIIAKHDNQNRKRELKQAKERLVQVCRTKCSVCWQPCLFVCQEFQKTQREKYQLKDTSGIGAQIAEKLGYILIPLLL
jgi:hypothetical protein